MNSAKAHLRDLVDRLPYVRRLRDQVDAQGVFPPGHYYSPIPSRKEVLAHVRSRPEPLSTRVPGIALNNAHQRKLLDSYAVHYRDLPFSHRPSPDCRYYYENPWFGSSDGIFLYCFLREHLPKRIVEVGSGFSSAVMLDTIDRFFSEAPTVTLIEPFPERLFSLLREADRERVDLVQSRVQDVDPQLFDSLESGDLLFIDSSHVVKCGSDVHFLLFEVLPRLQQGVYVHFHDIQYPFDYPSNWLAEGRYWNESYFIRAFLSWNNEWNITFFNTYAHLAFEEDVRHKMPLCTQDTTGGSLYIQRGHPVSRDTER